MQKIRLISLLVLVLAFLFVKNIFAECKSCILFAEGNCTKYVCEQRKNNILGCVAWGGNANEWLDNAKAVGYNIGNIPIVGAILVTNEDPIYGHVAFVESIDNQSNTFSVSEMNYKGLGIVSNRDINFNNPHILGFIYGPGISPYFTYFTFPNHSSQGWTCGYDTEIVDQTQADQNTWMIAAAGNNPGVVSPSFAKGINTNQFKILKFSARVDGTGPNSPGYAWLKDSSGNWNHGIYFGNVPRDYDYHEYTVLMNDESKHEAKVLARDPINDIAILKIEGQDFPTVELGDSSTLKVGQTVIAIGNALGEFRNTVSTGVISGLSRSITAGGAGIGSEQLIGVIQTDASINPGNSGGPLLNLAGQVIGINTAMASGAENIGFAIPINAVKNTIESVRQYGRIVRPWLGVRYVMVNKTIAEENKLSVDYGALIVRGEKVTDLAVIPGSPADKAGLEENDIILEVNGQKIDQDHPLAMIISRYQPGDEITLKVLHKGEEKEVKVKLEEMKE